MLKHAEKPAPKPILDIKQYSQRQIRAGKTHRIKRVIALCSLFISMLLTVNIANGQNIQGYIRDTSGNAIENVTIEAIELNDTLNRVLTKTDNVGYYSIENLFTTIPTNAILYTNTILLRTHSTIIATVFSQMHAKTAQLYNLSGQIVATATLIKNTNNSITATFDMPVNSNQIFIFNCNNQHAIKFIPSILPLNILVSLNNTNSLFKDSYVDNTSLIKFIIDDDEQDIYIPQEKQINIITDAENNVDFELEKWPEFFSNLFFNLKDKYDNIQANTTINVDEVNGLYSLSATTDDNGDAQITDISIPSLENKLIPDSLDFAVEILSDYLVTERDTLRKITNGDLTTNYHNLTPKQQQFFADLYTTITNNETGNPIEGVQGKLVLEGSTDTTTIITNALGEANFEDIEITPFNEITPDTLTYIYKLSGDGLETLIDTLKLTNGTFNEAYQMIEENVPPVPKDYTLIINSKDGNGDDLQNVDWLALTADSVLIGQGNTGANSLDTLLFQNLNQNLDIILKSNLTEHSDYRAETNLIAEQEELRTTNNTLLTYLYNLGVIARDSDTQTPLDSTTVEAFLNGNLLMSGNSLEETIVNLSTTQPGHTLDLKLLIDRSGYVKSDSIPTTITEGVANEVTYDLVKEEIIAPDSALLWRKFVPKIAIPGTTADVIIESSGYTTTITNVPSNTWWQDSVPVDPAGTTITYITHVPEGEIPHYDLTKLILAIQAGQQYIGIDTTQALEQQQKIKGKVVYGDSKTNATGLDIIIWNSDRTTQLDSIRSADGTYETGPYATGFEGWMDVHIPMDHPTNKDEEYFGHKGIHIGPKETNTYPPNGGPVLLTNKVINFADSVKRYNVVMTPTHWIDAESGNLAQVNPAHLFIMDGNTDYDMPLLKWGETNAYFKPSSENNQWLFDMATRIQDNFGIPFVVNEVSSELPVNGINITSLDDTYLNSVKSQMGMNVEVIEGKSGLAQTNGTDELEDINVHSTTDIRLRGPPGGTADSYSITSGERELLHRMKKSTDISSNCYKSIGNYAMPLDIDTTKMVYDHINYSIMDNNRRMRINSDENERVHNGSWTIRPNNDADFYSTTTQGDLYNEERWKHWDSTNIPVFNQKFFD